MDLEFQNLLDSKQQEVKSSDKKEITEEDWRGLLDQFKSNNLRQDDTKVEDILKDIEKDFEELDDLFKDLDGL